jgi:hypothetical protein
VWDVAGAVKPRAEVALEKARLDAMWATLGNEEPFIAWRVMQGMCSGGESTVEYIQAKLGTAPAVDPRLVERLVARLDADGFDERERAQAALLELGGSAGPALRAALERTESAEVRTRLGVLLERLANPAASPDGLREARAVEGLERMGTAAAWEALTRIAKARAGSPVGQRAAEAVARHVRAR